MNSLNSENNKLFESIKDVIDKNYTTINVIIVDGKITLKGTLRIKDEKNNELGSFLIEVIVPNNFPKEIPIVREIGGRIPVCSERHFDKPHGNACLYFRDAVFLYWNENNTVIDFMKKFVEPFFLWQIEYDITGGKNQSNSFKHGVEGAIQFYSEILNTDKQKIIFSFVKYLTKKKIKAHWPCFCLSGKRIKDCHFDLIKKYKNKIRRKDVQKTLGEFIKYGKTS